MKKPSKLIVLVLVIAMTLSICGQAVFASNNNDHYADTLNSLGLFLGTNNGYELDSQVTRVQAAIMLVRLLGAEKEAQSGGYSHPFADVPGWANHYIAYMYRIGLTQGVSDRTFNSDGLCNLQMYSTFILRALGYDEDSDFTYETAIDVSDELGLLDAISTRNDFLRGDMVALSYSALAAKLKDSDNTLLDKLVADDAVDADAAKPVQEMFAAQTDVENNSSGKKGTPEAQPSESNSADNKKGEDAVKDVRVKLTFNNEEVIVKMYDNPTSRDFLSLLPLTLPFKDFAGSEKISFLPKKLSTEAAPSGSDPSVGNFTYYTPWGNLAIFYKSFSPSSVLIPLGNIESGIEKLASIDDDFTVKIERMN